MRCMICFKNSSDRPFSQIDHIWDILVLLAHLKMNATAKKSYTIVVKLGSSSIVDEKTKEPRIANMSLLVETLVKLRRAGHKIVLVSSGAIAIGMKHVGIDKKPKKLPQKQALAAIGQGKLITLYDSMFRQLDQVTAQILLTRNDIIDFAQFRNAENTLSELIHMGAIPIVNENDTISTQEIKFGDNDTLSAITAGMCNADFLFLLTDVDCLYTDNPRTNPDAKPVVLVKNMNNLNVNTKSSGSAVGTGGMETKLIAADLATNAGVTTVICNSAHPERMLDIVKHCASDIVDGEDEAFELAALNETHEEFERVNREEFKLMKENLVPMHTRFIGQFKNSVKNKEFWLLHGLKAAGSLIVDLGCYYAITGRRRAGLLPVGIIGVQGSFQQLECVDLKLGFKDANGAWDKSRPTFNIGRARCNYSSSEIDKIKGLQSVDIANVLEYTDSEYIAHRHNLAFPVHMDSELSEFLESLKIKE